MESSRTTIELMAALEVSREVFKDVTGEPRENSHGKQEKIEFQAEECG